MGGGFVPIFIKKNVLSINFLKRGCPQINFSMFARVYQHILPDLLMKI